jgi:hypothetical protein
VTQLPTNAITTAYLAEVERRRIPHTELGEVARRCFDSAMTSYAGECMTRPVFLDHAQYTGLSTDMTQLHAALTSLPDRLFGGDLAAFARAVGMTQAQVSAILRGSAAQPTRLCRADLYLDDGGFRLMEVNMGSTIGGLDNALLNRAFLSQPVFAEFAAARKLTYIDTMAELVDTIRTECEIPEGARPLVAAADWPESFATLEPQLRHSARLLAALGLEVLPCHVGQLVVRDGRVWLDGRPIDVVYRIFMIEDLLQPEGPPLIDPVLRAAERGEVKIFTPMDAELYGSKGALALLSDEANRHLYSPAELASMDRILPWTRMVRPGPVTVGGEQADLTEYALSQRGDLILKPTLFHGGAGVVPGWQTEPDEWRRHLNAAMDGPFVLQRRIRAVPEMFPAAEGPQPWELAWGVFLGLAGYIGSLARGINDPGGGVVNVATGATLTCCFHEAVPSGQLPG